MKVILLLAVILVCGRCGLSLRVEVSPDEFHVITSKTVSVSCLPDKTIDQEALGVVMLEILKEPGKPMAILTQGSEIKYGIVNRMDYQVHGQISNTPSQSYLNLTLLDPTDEDMGSYKCSMYYLKKNGVLEKESAEGSLNMKRVGVNTAFIYLLDKISQLETKQKSMVEAFDTYLHKLEDKLLKHISKDRYVSAFTAKYTKSRSENTGDRIIFNEVLMKVGDGYDEATGLYTAPKSGLYEFHVTGMLKTSDGWMDLALWTGGKKMAGLSMGSGHIWDQSSISVLTQLKAGDVVEVKVNGKVKGKAMRNDLFSFFSGQFVRETMKR